MRTGVGERWIVLSNYWIGKITRLNGKLGDEQLQQSLSRREPRACICSSVLWV